MQRTALGSVMTCRNAQEYSYLKHKKMDPVPKVIRTVRCSKEDLDILLMEEQEKLKKNEIITLPLKKYQKSIDRDGRLITILETEVNFKKDIRIVRL